MVVQCSSDDVVADEKMLVHSQLQQKLHCTGAWYVDMSAPRQRSRDTSQVSRQIRRYPWAHLARPGLLGCGRPNKLHDPLWRRCIQPACTQFWHHIPMDEPRERTVKRAVLRSYQRIQNHSNQLPNCIRRTSLANLFWNIHEISDPTPH